MELNSLFTVKTLNTMHPDVENLINMALADGDITEKERSIILRKAETLGEDLDEVEMILEGKLSLLKKQVKPIQAQESAGNIIKCPQCKADIPSFSTKCEFCGHEFRNASVANSVKVFFEKLENLENNRKDSFTSKLFAGVVDDVAQKKAELVASFPIPNTKEDILEFLAMAVPRSRVNTGMFSSATQSEKVVGKAFQQKCEQIIMKASFSFKNDNATLEEIRYYANELKIKMR